MAGRRVCGRLTVKKKDIVPTCACTEKGTKTLMMMMMMMIYLGAGVAKQQETASDDLQLRAVSNDPAYTRWNCQCHQLDTANWINTLAPKGAHRPFFGRAILTTPVCGWRH
jgi:hypothetical protein